MTWRKWLMPIILATQDAETRRMVAPGPPRQKFVRPHLNQKKLDMMACSYNPSYTRSINRRIIVLAGLGMNVKPYLKNT
jgi:hypothetical protein